MKLTKKIFISLAPILTVTAAASTIALVSCSKGTQHITIDEAAKTRTIQDAEANFPMVLSDINPREEDIKVELASPQDPNWVFSLRIEPGNDSSNIRMHLSLSYGIRGQTHSFDAKFTTFKINSGDIVWSQTITNFKIIY